MSTPQALAALYVEVYAYATRDDYEHEFSASGYVSWDPVAQEHHVSGVELRVPSEVGRLRETEKIEVIDRLAAAAERKGVGCCVACIARGGTKRQATGSDWLCDEDRAASPALTLIKAHH